MSISLFLACQPLCGATYIDSILLNTDKKALKNNHTKKKPIYFIQICPQRKCKTKKLLGKIHSDKASINKSIKYSQAAYLLWYTNVFSGFSVFSDASGASEQSSM